MVVAGAPEEAIYMFTISRMDALALGAIAAAMLRIPSVAARVSRFGGRTWVVGIVLGVGGALLTHGYSLHRALGNTIGYSILALVFATMVLGAAQSDLGKVRGWASSLRVRPLRVIGKYSYAMYVFHKPLHDFLGKPLVRHLGANLSHPTLFAISYTAIGTAVTFALAFLSFHLFERPILRLKTRFAPRAAPASAG